MPTIALVGNPNSGKSTLFTSITGSHQRVGNWPGVTVEKKTGTFTDGKQSFDIIDLPGLYDLQKTDSGPIDEKIVSDYLEHEPPDVIINVVDSTTLARSLFLTTQLRELNIPLVVCLNMFDVATRNKIDIDTVKLAETLQCQVIPMVASRGTGVEELKNVLHSITGAEDLSAAAHADVDVSLPERHLTKRGRYDTVDSIVNLSVAQPAIEQTLSSRIDSVVLNRYLAFPLFLLVMYLMFLFTINIGSAFIDFFDILGQAVFVDGPRLLMDSLGLPNWLIALLSDGVGGGVQLVCTFIPVIACLFLFLSRIGGLRIHGSSCFHSRSTDAENRLTWQVLRPSNHRFRLQCALRDGNKKSGQCARPHIDDHHGSLYVLWCATDSLCAFCRSIFPEWWSEHNLRSISFRHSRRRCIGLDCPQTAAPQRSTGVHIGTTQLSLTYDSRCADTNMV